MKLSVYSGFAVLAGLTLSLANMGCSTKDRTNTAADRPESPAGYADRNTGVGASAADREFAARAAEGGKAEVEMGNLAQQQGSVVKEYGKKLVDDHTRMNNELTEIGAKEGLALPADMAPKQRETVENFSKLAGPKFDKEFLKESIDDHKRDIDEFQKEARSGEDQALRSFASRNVAILRDHLNTAESLYKTVK